MWNWRVCSSGDPATDLIDCGKCREVETRNRTSRPRPKANGAGVSTSPTLACSGSGRLGRSPFPRERFGCSVPVLAGRSFALLAARWFREEPAFIVRTPLLASGSRQAVGSGAFGKPFEPFPSTWRFRDHFAALPFRAFRSATREAPLSFRPFRPLMKQPADGLPLAASAVRQIQTEVILRRVFRHCCGHCCQIVPVCFPFPFQRFPASSSSSVSPSR